VAGFPDDILPRKPEEGHHGLVNPGETVPGVDDSDRLGHRNKDLFPVHPADSSFFFAFGARQGGNLLSILSESLRNFLNKGWLCAFISSAVSFQYLRY
jgi:hypothetical protein